MGHMRPLRRNLRADGDQLIQFVALNHQFALSECFRRRRVSPNPLLPSTARENKASLDAIWCGHFYRTQAHACKCASRRRRFDIDRRKVRLHESDCSGDDPVFVFRSLSRTASPLIRLVMQSRERTGWCQDRCATCLDGFFTARRYD